MIGKVTPRQFKAIRELLASGNVTAAAGAAGVSRNTVHKWLRGDEAFQLALEEAEAEALKRLSLALVRLGKAATDTLEEAINGGAGATMATRVRASDIALGRLLQLREIVDLEARVKALEEGRGDL